MTVLHLVADHLAKQANSTRRKGEGHTVLADAYGRSAFNRYYYACFLNVREFVSTIDSNWGKVKHAEVPTLLRVSVNKKIDIELKKSERIGDLTQGEYQSKKSMLLTSLDNMASTMSLAYTIRGVVDYEPEIEMIFSDGCFSINTTSVASAKGWLQTINVERAKVAKIMREVGFV
ncbi:hypothetical protein ACE3IL_07530 [Enterobacter hormaechei subsp. steigerwaltii]|uniref:hypothetical protein n=1 Tax=Enterobacter hormaechei TaxID=158836 RepID=UPI001C63F44A|nr:hypothetical protein [Enterobacter hormaechei]HDS5872120.1 hypothetical protein [Enterobacter hormaechei subsp. steigerwaltii]ELC6552994.1 hypothetical protein [Enterobacter hormaechei]ELD7983152.1 hypothetical protein [Enterobacter hormaechei]MBW7741696.1 hypothetical protein [Enterobacter hormaechei]MCM7616353.1 hypothetical protein [Enterobacter hormaechei]